jgi:hypothetical protein
MGTWTVKGFNGKEDEIMEEMKLYKEEKTNSTTHYSQNLTM